MTIQLLIHQKILDDIKKNLYIGLEIELHRICRLLMQDGKLPGESPFRHVKLPCVQNKIFHAGINLPKENVGKRRGARIIYVREDFDLIKVIYIGGHKDRRYNNGFLQMKLIEERYSAENYIQYTEGFQF